MIFSIHIPLPFPLTRTILTLIMKYNDKLSLFLYNIVCKYFKRQDIYEYKKLKKHFLLMMPHETHLENSVGLVAGSKLYINGYTSNWRAKFIFEKA